MSEDEWARLGRLVRERREHLGLTLAQVAAAGGPSVATLGLIELAKQSSYRPRVIQKLEDALAWQRGSVRAVLGGGEPTLVSDATELIKPANARLTPNVQFVRDKLEAAQRAIQQAMTALDQTEGE